MTRAIFIGAVLCTSAFNWFLTATHPLAADPSGPADSAARISAKAVWNPTSNELSNIHRKCTEGDPPQHEACFLDAMKTAGASAEAMAFVREFAPNGLAYIRAFRDTGRVDIAYVEYLFRANDLDGVLLVNGSPAIIDIDDYKFISPEDLCKNADYAALLQEYPNTNVFPADRYHTTLPSDSSSDDGWQTFRVEYLLLDGCHACARVGTLVMSFRFDSGHFVGAHISEVRTGVDEDRPALSRRAKPGDVVTKEARLDPTKIQAKAGSSFPITLPANHTTGYSWRLAKPLNPDLLRQVSDIYSEETSIRAGGKEVWTFEALTKGTTELYFEYARPWEKDGAPVNTAKYKVEIK